MFIISIDKGEKIKDIFIESPKSVIELKCPKCKWCKRRIEFWEKKRFIRICKCWNCKDKEVLLKSREIDLIQPNSPFWDLVYPNVFKDYESNKRKIEWDEEKRKEALDAKYDQQFRKPWEKKLVKDWVLGGKKIW